MIPLALAAPELPDSAVYPASAGERDRWILSRRGLKNPLDPQIPYAFLQEEEPGENGAPVPTATLFLTNRECPYRCVMCDLWQNTLDETVPAGAIAAQIRSALSKRPPGPRRTGEIGLFPRSAGVRGPSSQIKLYNAGSFFDPRAIPPEDYPEIAETVAGFDRVIVECHPRLIGERTLAFRDLIRGKLEVAIGLETVHPGVLDRLNKRFTVADFERAAAFLQQNDIALRVFLLLRPPFLTEEEGVYWAMRSLDIAFAAGATVCCVIPTRAGNGAMEALAEAGEYHPPSLRSLERVVEYGLELGAGRVFADLWDVERFYTCDCSAVRATRLAEMNRTQRVTAPVMCAKCEGKDKG